MKLTPGKVKQIESALDLLEATYDPVLAIWPMFPAEKKAAVLADSPLFARLLKLVNR